MDFKGEQKIAVIGCGYWGSNLVRNFSELGALIAISDANPTTASKFSEEFKVPALNIEEIMNNPSIDGVVIATPAIQHAVLAKKALKAGKNVFVEKPLSLNVDDGRELCSLAADNALSLMVGHVLQYHPAFLKMKEMVRSGDLGVLQYISSERVNLGKIRIEENVLWSFAPHDLSMILTLVDAEPTRVFATGSAFLNKDIVDTATTHIDFANGIAAQVYVSWLHPFKRQTLVVIGSEGMAVFDDGQSWESKLLFYPHKIKWRGDFPEGVKAEAIPIPLTICEPLKAECQAFLDSIAQKKKPLSDAEEGLRVLKVLEAAQKSMDEKKPVDFTYSRDNKLQDYFVHESSYLDDGVEIGNASKIWHFSHICKGAKIGKAVIIGQNVMIGPDVIIGDYCKIQNNVSLYNGVELQEGVFCGPSCVFTNVNTPRAQIERKSEFLKTVVGRGATIGANATIVCGNSLGEYCLIAAGAVVTKDVPAHALMAGVPARRIGWVSHSGEVLGPDLICPREGRRYEIINSETLQEIFDDAIRKSA